MIVAVTPVGTVEVTLDEIVEVIAVRNRFVAAARTVLMVGVMSAARVLRRAAFGMFGVDVDDVLVDVPLMRVVHVPVVQVVRVPCVRDGGVPAAWAVLVRMVRMRDVLAHAESVRRGSRRGKQIGARRVLSELRPALASP